MQDDFLLPPVTVDWKPYRSPAATSWMLSFAGSLQYWQQLTHVVLYCISLE